MRLSACKKSGCSYVRPPAGTGIYKISGKPVCKGLFFSKAKYAINQQDKNAKKNLFEKTRQNIWQFHSKHLPLHSQSENECNIGLIR